MRRPRRIVFRATASREAGLGHVRRCLSLAHACADCGLACRFVLHGTPEGLDLVGEAGFEAELLDGVCATPADAVELAARGADILVADAYDFDSAYLAALARPGSIVAAVDDLAAQQLPAQVVINGALGAEGLPYPRNGRTLLLLGAAYALLRPEFAHPVVRTMRPRIERVLVTAGGSDPRLVTRRVVDALAELDVELVVIEGPFGDGVSGAAVERDRARIRVVRTPSDMRALMLDADLAVSGGGQTLYELAACGTPALGIRMAPNQTRSLLALDEAGVVQWIADAADATLQEGVARGVARLAGDTAKRTEMSAAGRRLVDGQGAARVARALIEQWRVMTW
jgi:UDP-2,4-diacetamido-2,4,6-trideoxy-beta-L-altropyranose hydrolase